MVIKKVKSEKLKVKSKAVNINNRTIIIGVASCIAGYKTVDLIKLLMKEGFDVWVVMTENAVKMFGKEIFEEVSGREVYSQIILQNFNYKKTLKTHLVPHVELANRASAIIIAPATANIIGKIACGIADDFLTTLVLASTATKIICPSMNTGMWNNTIFQENLNKLKKNGLHVIGPDTGNLACGTTGTGRFPAVEFIKNESMKILESQKSLTGKRIMVTAGGTMEPIDAVRVISNNASGKMGKAIAEEAYKKGGKVLLVRAGNAVKSDYPIKQLEFTTSTDLEEIIKENIEKYDYVFHTAAVSDYQPEEMINDKIDSMNDITIKLIPTGKIISKIKKWNPKIKLIGFKAVYKKSDKEMKKIGLEKLKSCEADYIVVNDIGRKDIGFGAENNEVILISEKYVPIKIIKADKKIIAVKILEYVYKYREIPRSASWRTRDDK